MLCVVYSEAQQALIAIATRCEAEQLVAGMMAARSAIHDIDSDGATADDSGHEDQLTSEVTHVVCAALCPFARSLCLVSAATAKPGSDLMPSRVAAVQTNATNENLHNAVAAPVALVGADRRLLLARTPGISSVQVIRSGLLKGIPNLKPRTRPYTLMGASSTGGATKTGRQLTRRTSTLA